MTDAGTRIAPRCRSREQWAYFDHAAVAPLVGPGAGGPARLGDDQTDNGLIHERRWNERVEAVRGLAARLIGAEPLDVAFVKNTSEGIGIVAEGFPWQAGDNVVIAQEEYPANQYPWMNLHGPRRRGARRRQPAGRAPVDRRRRRGHGWAHAPPQPELGRVRQRLSQRPGRPGRAVPAARHRVLRRCHPGAGRLPAGRASARRSTSSPPTGTSGCSARRAPASSTIRRDWIERLRPVDIGWNSVVGADATSRRSTSASSRTPGATRAAR